MQQVTVVFTAQEIMEQIHRELFKLGADLVNIPLEYWKQYILARAIEDVLMVDLSPHYDAKMEPIATLVRSNYRRSNGEDIFTLQYDIGTNKLLPHIGSYDLSFESHVELYRNRVSIIPRARDQ
jgi:hypothetical protein